ncbi:hypothetical protein E4T56_gene16354 [Termitomyces sp. T112]|nr:hypothetical protein E4T56_gene16354 [Termitomyces sp. T112]
MSFVPNAFIRDMTSEIETRYRAILETLLSAIASFNPLNGAKLFLFNLATPLEQAFIAPINRLPPEVLTHIFFCSLENNAYDLGTKGPPVFRRFPKISISPGGSSDPMVLAQVCMLWRAIALSTPLLWSQFSIYCSRKQQIIPILKAWLERSSDLPLTFTFFESLDGLLAKQRGPHHPTYGDPYQPAYNPLTTEVVSLLLEHSHRWKSVDFRFSRQLSHVLINMPEGRLPILESASIESRDAVTLPCPPRDGLPQLEKVWKTMYSSPRFTSGKWEIDYLEATPSLLILPWSRLTTADLSMTIKNLFKVLRECQNLTTLRFVDPYAVCHHEHLNWMLKQATGLPLTHKPNLPDLPVTLPFLQKLHLTTEESADTMFQKLTLPALTSLSIKQNWAWKSEPDPTEFLEFLNRSGCQLEKYFYNISGAPISEKVLVAILESPSMSSVTSLQIDPPMTDKLFSLLTRVGERTAVLPRLERLTLGRCKNLPGSLIGMAQSRVVKTSDLVTLRDLYIHRWDFHELDVEGFKRLAEQGMLLDVPSTTD